GRLAPVPPPSRAKARISDIVSVFAFSEAKVSAAASSTTRQARRSGAAPVPATAGAAESPGEVAEWSNVPDSKSGVRFPRTVGSNPTLSARFPKRWQAALNEVPRQRALDFEGSWLYPINGGRAFIRP